MRSLKYSFHPLLAFVRLVISIYIYGKNMQANEAGKLEEREAKVVPGGAL